MPSITYVQPSGEQEKVDVADGASVMRAALQNGISGIVGECGGQAMCATCHVYVAADADLGPLSDDEEEMLACTADERTSESRLGCQLRAGENFTDLEVRLPEHQL